MDENECLPELKAEFITNPPEFDQQTLRHPTAEDYILSRSALPRGCHLGETYDLSDDAILSVAYSTRLNIAVGYVLIEFVLPC